MSRFNVHWRLQLFARMVQEANLFADGNHAQVDALVVKTIRQFMEDNRFSNTDQLR